MLDNGKARYARDDGNTVYERKWWSIQSTMVPHCAPKSPPESTESKKKSPRIFQCLLLTLLT